MRQDRPVTAAPFAEQPQSEGAATPLPARVGKGGLPRILTAAIERLEAYLDDPASSLPTLNTANGNDRQQRLERRRACVQLLRAQIQYMDLASMRVGVPQTGGKFLCLTLKFLARKAGLGLRRAERAMADLLRAGLVRSSQRCAKDEAGNYRGLAAIRQLPVALFGALGLGRWLRHERSKAVMRRHREAAAAQKVARGKREEAMGRLFLNGLGHRIQQGARVARRRLPANTGQLTGADLELEIGRRVGMLKMQHPGWDRDTCYAQARRELGIA
jgi:hypothetical protein